MAYWQVEINIGNEYREILAASFFEIPSCEGVFLDEEKFKNLEYVSNSASMVVYFSEKPVLDDLKKLIKESLIGDIEFNIVLSQVEEKDWSEEWKKNWEPSKISDKIVICPTWREYTPKKDENVITLDPGAAFGTGTHSTTQLCICAMEKYMKSLSILADVGCGSGILAIAAVKLGAKSVIAVDNDEKVIPIAQNNATINNVEDKIKFFTATSKNLLGQKFDFICANILHNVLIEIMPELKQLLKDDAKMVLSGILDEKAESVIKAVSSEGLKLVETLKQKNWVALVVSK